MGDPPPRPHQFKRPLPFPEIRDSRVRGGSAGLTGAGYDSARDCLSWNDSRRRRPVEVRGADRYTGNQALAACAALLRITRSVAGSGRLKAAFDPTGHIAGGAGELDFSRVCS